MWDYRWETTHPIHAVARCCRGRAFEVLLPCIARDDRDHREVNEIHAPILSASLATGTVLMIEDEDTLRLAVTKMLRKKGFAVIEAADGNTAVDLFVAHAREIELVLLDLTLPGRSGRDILSELQRIRSDVKVIITSAYSHDKVRSSLAGLRTCGYLQKPYEVNDLVQLLGNCLTHGHEPPERQAGDPLFGTGHSI